MDARIQKHRMIRWVGSLLFLSTFAVSWQAQAAIESVPPKLLWCNRVLCKFTYPTALSAAQAFLDDYCSVFPSCRFTLIGCNRLLAQNIANCTYSRAIGANDSFNVYEGIACPEPIVYLAVPYTFNTARGMCERDVPDQETYTLALTPESATIEPGESYSFAATVTKQGGGTPSKSVPVSVKVEVDPSSGGHAHGETYAKRDKGTVSPATGTNSFSITFGSTEVSGTHTITATCDLCVNSPKTATVKVMIKAAQTGDLIPIPDSPTLYALTDSKGDVIGAVKNVHTGNHFLTKAAIGKLNKLAKLFTTKVDSNVVLYLNDASLVWGGMFDVDINNPWATPHTSHDIGTSLDIRAQNSFPIKEGAVPITDFLKFITESKKNHFRVALHCKGSTQTSVCYGKLDNRHFHVDF